MHKLVSTSSFPAFKSCPPPKIIDYAPVTDAFLGDDGCYYTSHHLMTLGYDVTALRNQLSKHRRINQMSNAVPKFLVLDSYADIVDKCLTEAEALAKLVSRGDGYIALIVHKAETITDKSVIISSRQSAKKVVFSNVASGFGTLALMKSGGAVVKGR